MPPRCLVELPQEGPYHSTIILCDCVRTRWGHGRRIPSGGEGARSGKLGGVGFECPARGVPYRSTITDTVHPRSMSRVVLPTKSRRIREWP